MHLNWPGFNDNDTVLIDMSNEPFDLPKSSFYINGQHFVRKDELHVTLLGSKLGRLLQDRQATDPASEDDIRAIFEAIDWSYAQTGPCYLLSRQRGAIRQGSIIMLIDMPGLKVFYEALIDKGYIEKDTPLPPAHVTLYTHNNPHGIGVPNQDVLETLSIRSLSIDDLEALYDNHS
jgi:hypothetical protein